MATLTSTGSVSLGSATNWSPSQIPTANDDIVLAAGHALTVDADATINSLVVNSSNSSRLVPTGVQVLTITNGVQFLGSAGQGKTNAFCNVPAGTDLTIIGSITKGTINANTWLFNVTGTLRLHGPSGVDSVLFDWPITGSGTDELIYATGHVESRGSINFQTADNGAEFFELRQGSTWDHQGDAVVSTTTSNFTLCDCRGGAVDFAGDVHVIDFPSSGSRVFVLQSTAGTINYTGRITSNHITNSGSTTSLVFINQAASVFRLTGSITFNNAKSENSSIYCASGAVEITNQSIDIPQGENMLVVGVGGSVDLAGLTVNNAGSFNVVGVNAIITATTPVNITNTNATAQAAIPQLENVNITNTPSDPPTLPPTGRVVLGEVYGYAETPLTGEGLILEPSVLSAAIRPDLEVINSGVQRSSLLVPHTQELS